MERRVVEAVTQPLYSHEQFDPTYLCSMKIKEKKEAVAGKKLDYGELYEKFLIREARKIFAANKTILALQLESMTMRRRTEISHQFLSVGLEPIFYPHEVLRKAVDDTKWIHFKNLLLYQTMLLVSPDTNVAACFKISKKLPEVVLLGGLVDDRLMTKEELVRYSQLHSIGYLYSQLSALLSLSTNQTHSLLGEHQRHLTQSLQQYINQTSSSISDDQAKL